MKLTYQSEVGELQSVILKHPEAAFRSNDEIEKQWQPLNYLSAPHFEAAMKEYLAFSAILERYGVQTYHLPEAADCGMDSIYTRDAAVVCNKGVILCNMGKAARGAEPQAQGQRYRELGIRILGRIAGEGRLEGGDLLWLNERTVAVGLGYRTNLAGIQQLRALLSGQDVSVIEVPLPHWQGPDDVFHLMSIISPLDKDLAVVYSPLMPVVFRQSLLEQGFELLEVTREEFDNMGCNILALGPRRCLMMAGNPALVTRLERAGVEVLQYEGREISLKGCGGPTCLTRPLLRKI